jgi:hypothetical protein
MLKPVEDGRRHVGCSLGRESFLGPIVRERILARAWYYGAVHQMMRDRALDTLDAGTP